MINPTFSIITGSIEVYVKSLVKAVQSNFLPVTQETVFSKIYQVLYEPKEIATVSFQKKKKMTQSYLCI